MHSNKLLIKLAVVFVLASLMFTPIIGAQTPEEETTKKTEEKKSPLEFDEGKVEMWIKILDALNGRVIFSKKKNEFLQNLGYINMFHQGSKENELFVVDYGKSPALEKADIRLRESLKEGLRKWNVDWDDVKFPLDFLKEPVIVETKGGVFNKISSAFEKTPLWSRIAGFFVLAFVLVLIMVKRRHPEYKGSELFKKTLLIFPFTDLFQFLKKEEKIVSGMNRIIKEKSKNIVENQKKFEELSMKIATDLPNIYFDEPKKIMKAWIEVVEKIKKYNENLKNELLKYEELVKRYEEHGSKDILDDIMNYRNRIKDTQSTIAKRNEGAYEKRGEYIALKPVALKMCLASLDELKKIVDDEKEYVLEHKPNLLKILEFLSKYIRLLDSQDKVLAQEEEILNVLTKGKVKGIALPHVFGLLKKGVETKQAFFEEEQQILKQLKEIKKAEIILKNELERAETKEKDVIKKIETITSNPVESKKWIFNRAEEPLVIWQYRGIKGRNLMMDPIEQITTLAELRDRVYSRLFAQGLKDFSLWIWLQDKDKNGEPDLIDWIREDISNTELADDLKAYLASHPSPKGEKEGRPPAPGDRAAKKYFKELRDYLKRAIAAHTVK